MKFRPRYILLLSLIVLLLGCFSNRSQAQAQFPIVKFSSEQEEFIKQLNEFLAASRMAQVIKSGEDFTSLWQSGKFNQEQKQLIIATCQIMGQKRYRPSPHFEHLLDMVIMANKKGLNTDQITSLLQTTKTTYEKIDDKVQTSKYIGNLMVFFKYNSLYTNGFYSLRVKSNSKYRFRYADEGRLDDTTAYNKPPKENFSDFDKETDPATGSVEYKPPSGEPEEPQPALAGPIIEFESTTIRFESGFDSSTLAQTKGAYMFNTGVFVGEGGTFDWSAAGMPKGSVYGQVKKYNFNVKYQAFTASNVMLYYPGKLEATVLGVMEYRSVRKNKFEEPKYPRFKSYYAESVFKDVKPLYEYLGGFSLEGRKINSSSVYGGKALLKIKHKDKSTGQASLPVRMVSNRFEFLDSAVVTESANVSIYFGADSITHPSCRVVYNPNKKELRLYKDKGRFRECPFINSYQNIEMLADLLVYNLEQEKIDLYILTGKAQVPALFESSDLFLQKRFSDIQGLFNYHPLAIVAAYAKKTGYNEFNVYDVAQDTKISVSGLKSGILSASNQGYLEYNPTNGEIKVKEKLWHYVNSAKGKKDFDMVSIPSVAPPKYNGSLNLATKELNVFGVKVFSLADSLGVFATPRNKEVKLIENRDIEFDGKLNAGNFQIYGTKFKFEYDDFKVDMNAIDSLELRPVVDPNDKKQGKDSKKHVNRLYGQDKNAPQQIANPGKGVVYINKSDNKSGKKKLTQYPILEINSPLYIYFNKKEVLRGVYNTRVYFKIPPFKIDSSNSSNSSSISFKGTFVSDSIFPSFSEKLGVRPDKSLGFEHKTPVEGYQLYGGLGKFFGTITLDYKGIRGKGEIKYLTTTIRSDDFIFYQDSVIARGKSIDIKEGKIGDLEVPDANIAAFKMRWYPKRDSLYLISTKAHNFRLYKNTVTLEGSLILTSTGTFGKGYIQMVGARAEAEQYKFNVDNFTGRNGFFEVKSTNPIKPHVSCKNVKFDFQMKQRKVTFQPEVEGDASNSMPYVMYKTSIPNAVWDIDKKVIVMDAPKDVDNSKSVFYSTLAVQDSLNFTGRHAEYNITRQRLVIDGVPYIRVADAEITPDSNRVIITENANMRALKNAIVVVDTLNKFHRLAKGNIKIAGRREYSGDGIYQYVNILGDTIPIKFDQFEFAPVLVDAQGKKLTEKTFQTVSGGTIPDEKPIKIASSVLYRGGAFMYANKPVLEFKGEIKLDFKNNKNTDWMKYETKGDDKELIIDVRDAKDRDGYPLVTGLFIDENTSELYSAFVGLKRAENDKEVFGATGMLNFLDITQEFKVGPQDKIDGKTYEGNVFVYNDSLNTVSYEGKLKLQGTVDKDFNLTASALGKGRLDSNRFDFDAFVALDISLDAKALKLMGETLHKRVEDLGLPEATDDKIELVAKLADAAGNKAAMDYEKATNSKYLPICQVILQFSKSIILEKVKLKWSKKNQAFYSVGKLAVNAVGGVNVNGKLDGYVEVKKTPNGEVVNIYIEGSPDTWYYFSFDEEKRCGILSSNEAFDNLVLAKAKGREGTGKFFTAAADIVEKAQFIKRFKKEYLNEEYNDQADIDSHSKAREKAEEPPAAPAEEDEEAPKPESEKSKKKKKEGDEGFDPDAEEEPSKGENDKKEVTPEEGQETSDEETEKPKDKEKKKDKEKNKKKKKDKTATEEEQQEEEKDKEKEKTAEEEGF